MSYKSVISNMNQQFALLRVAAPHKEALNEGAKLFFVDDWKPIDVHKRRRPQPEKAKAPSGGTRGAF